MLYPQFSFTYFAFLILLGGAPDMGDMGFDFPVSSNVPISENGWTALFLVICVINAVYLTVSGYESWRWRL